MPESNYEITKHKMQTVFSNLDFAEIAKEWNLQYEDGCLKVQFADLSYQIRQDSGQVWCESKNAEADFNVAMTLFDILSRKRAVAAGAYDAVHRFSKVQQSSAGIGMGFFSMQKKLFDHKDAALIKACQSMGGQPFGKADVGYEIPVFQNMCVVFQFWNSDDEFDAEISLLCDKNTLQFMHYETLMYMLGHVVERIENLM